MNAFMQDPKPLAHRSIDVHQHFAPASYIRAKERFSSLQHGQTNLSTWSVEDNLRSMDRNGIEFGIASVTAPGVWFGEASQASELAQLWNDEAHEICEKGEGRFGFFAALPLPSEDGSAAEVARIDGSPHLQGYSVFTNYDGVWLGDRLFEKTLELLDKLGVTLFVHPTTSFAGQTIPGFRPQILECPFDTTRAAAHLISTGTLERLTRTRFLLSHGGGCIAYLAGRIDDLDDAKTDTIFYKRALQRLHFDTALVSEVNLEHLLRFIPEANVHFGSDAPFSNVPSDGDFSRFACTPLSAVKD